MAVSENLQSITLTADASIGIYTGVPGNPGSPQPHGGMQYRFVKATGKWQAGLATTPATDAIVGVLQNKPQGVDHAATVAYAGVTPVIAGANFASGTKVASNATGQAVAYTGTGDQLAGIALDAGTTGNLVSVLLKL